MRLGGVEEAGGVFDEGGEFAVGHGLLVAGEFAEDRPDGLGDLGVGHGCDTAGFWHWFRKWILFAIQPLPVPLEPPPVQARGRFSPNLGGNS